MEITVAGRHTEIENRFRAHAEDKLAKVTQIDPSVQRVAVEVTREKNPKLAAVAERVELTVRVPRGPVVRAEAAADDRYGALDLALDKLLERLRRSRDRRKDHHRAPGIAHVPVEVAAEPSGSGEAPGLDPHTRAAIADLGSDLLVENEADAADLLAEDGGAVELTVNGQPVIRQLGDSPVIIRQKLHTADRITVDEAVEQMELVGHDFFLFIDSDSGRPSAVYRRKGWTYGVLQLDAEVK